MWATCHVENRGHMVRITDRDPSCPDVGTTYFGRFWENILGHKWPSNGHCYKCLARCWIPGCRCKWTSNIPNVSCFYIVGALGQFDSLWRVRASFVRGLHWHCWRCRLEYVLVLTVRVLRGVPLPRKSTDSSSMSCTWLAKSSWHFLVASLASLRSGSFLAPAKSVAPLALLCGASLTCHQGHMDNVLHGWQKSCGQGFWQIDELSAPTHSIAETHLAVLDKIYIKYDNVDLQ